MPSFVKPRRPAILSPEQRESLSGGEDPTAITEIAQLAARALFADSPVYSKYQPAVRELLKSGGIDQVGELWSNSPANSLPGVLWRLFLIQQWYQRDPQTVQARYAQGQEVLTSGKSEIKTNKDLAEINLLLTALWTGHLPIPFPQLLVIVHDYLLILAAGVCGEWITDQRDQLADPVTLRPGALKETALELAQAARLASSHRLS